MLIRFVLALFFVAVLVIGSGAVVNRGWNVTHRLDPNSDIGKAKPTEVVASVIAWVNESPASAVPGLTRQVAEAAPWLPNTTLNQLVAPVTGLVASLPAWATSPGAAVSALMGEVQPQAPAVKPVQVAAPVSAPAPAPAPVKVASVPPAPVAAPAPPVAPAPAPPVVKASPPVPAVPAPQLLVPRQEVVSAGLSMTQKGCAFGGLTGAGATLVLGPAEVAAWVTGSVVLPATARLVGTVVGAALVSGCVAGALVAPAIGK